MADNGFFRFPATGFFGVHPADAHDFVFDFEVFTAHADSFHRLFQIGCSRHPCLRGRTDPVGSRYRPVKVGEGSIPFKGKHEKKRRILFFEGGNEAGFFSELPEFMCFAVSVVIYNI